jgi:hypothetical protein
MHKTTPLFPQFNVQTLRRKPRSAQKKLGDELALLRQKSFKQTGELFGRFIPVASLAPETAGLWSRRRFFSKENTVWAFFSQVLDADGGCREVVKKLQAYASAKGIKIPSSSTASYCTARKNIPESLLEEIFDHTGATMDQTAEYGLMNGRRVIVVDGTGISMPDTEANQEEWPQISSQKPGCGFPTARICACFSLQTGGLLSYEIGSKKSHELPLLRKQLDTFRENDIFLGDKGFCSYFDVATFQDRQVDSVVTLAHRTPVSSAKAIKKIGDHDLLIEWRRPYYQKQLSYSKEQWEQLPKRLVLRQIKVFVHQPGFRVKQFYIATTLLDAGLYPAEKLAELYFQRWDVELFFRDIKTTMGMDILRCHTPQMIRKEILMHLIAYNCIRRLMTEAAEEADMPVRLVSFKGSLQALRNWEPHMSLVELNSADRFRLISDLYQAITGAGICQRPGRREPRCLKRRPKNFQHLTAPRSEMVEIPHRSKYRAATP